MKLNEYKNKIKKNRKIRETKLYAIPRFPVGIICGPHRDHLRFGIICGTIWGSFPVWGSFAVGDHLRRCTDLLTKTYNGGTKL